MNINPKSKRILIFGDSNTWGYIPSSKHERYANNVRYNGVLQKQLGNDFEIIEEGLNSRGIVNGDPRPGKEGRSAIDYIIPCLDSHDPLDIVCVMLGTNELKNDFNNSPEQIGEYLKELLNIIIKRKSQFKDIFPKVVLITPPLVNDQTEYCKTDNKYLYAREKSQKLPQIYQNIAKEIGVEFLDITNIANTGEDGIHLTQESHYKIGMELASLILETI